MVANNKTYLEPELRRRESSRFQLATFLSSGGRRRGRRDRRVGYTASRQEMTDRAFSQLLSRNTCTHPHSAHVVNMLTAHFSGRLAPYRRALIPDILLLPRSGSLPPNSATSTGKQQNSHVGGEKIQSKAAAHPYRRLRGAGRRLHGRGVHLRRRQRGRVSLPFSLSSSPSLSLSATATRSGKNRA